MRAILAATVLACLLLTVGVSVAQEEGTGTGSGASSDKLKEDALKALLGTNGDKPGEEKPSREKPEREKAEREKAEREKPEREKPEREKPAGDRPARPAENVEGNAEGARDAAARTASPSRSRRDAGDVPEGAVPVVPEVADNSLLPVPANDEDALLDNADMADTTMTAPSDDYRDAAPQEEPLRPAAENAGAEVASGSTTGSSLVILGLVLLAVLLVALAAVVGIMAANRPGMLEEAASAEDAEGATALPDWGYLTAPEAPNISLRHTPFIIGSAAECNLRLADPKASPHHARIDHTETGYTLTDLHSENGTFLNGERVTMPVSLRPGDEIRMGDIVVHFQMHV